eukprot:354846-Chlamydomonas_euryale.AAC.9
MHAGPLYFGFSDSTNQKAIAAMYTAAEVEAAANGSRVDVPMQRDLASGLALPRALPRAGST